MQAIVEQVFDFWRVFGNFWYLWLPIALFFLFRESWKGYLRGYFLSNKKWILLEIRVPRDVAKSPKAMESIFAGLHSAGKSIDLVDRYWKGYENPWFSLEVIGNASGVHFFIWTEAGLRRLVESQIYAQYPASEITEVPDYARDLPPDVPNNDWTLWGAEMVLTKPDAYPIRTYEDFTLEDISEKEELRKIDPLSSMVEFLGSLEAGEQCWIQFIVRPAGEGWKKEGEALMAKIIGREVKKEENFFQQVLRWVSDFVGSLGALLATGAPTASPPDKKDDFSIFKLSPGQQETIKAVERNITKIGFEVGLRWMYIARRDKFNPVGISALFGIFKQFTSQSLNGFKPYRKTSSMIGYWQYVPKFKAIKEHTKKRRIYRAYRMRGFFFPPFNKVRPFVLSSSELATVYHFPGIVAGAPAMARIEAKKGSAPPNLPL
ncbi:MAG TPA: hypothetical protein VJC20_01990 [Candidatus Paceibacterota bacterium]